VSTLSESDWLRALELGVNEDFSQVAATARQWLEDNAAHADPVRVRRVELVHAAASTRLGLIEDGATRMREIRQWAHDRDERYLQARAERLLGVLLRRAGEATASLEHAVASVNLLPDDAHQAVLADHRIGLADALALSGSIQEALTEYDRAQQIAAACQITSLYLLALNNRVYTLFEAGQLDQAVVGADELLAATARAGTDLPLHVIDTVATAFSAVGRLEEAERLFAKADLTDDVAPEDAAETTLSLARIRRERGDLAGAREALERVFATCAGQNLGGVEVRALCERAELLAASGDFQAAFEQYKEYHERLLAQRVVEQEARARMMQAIFETSQARRESERFREMSYRDPLTKLRNRRYVDERLGELIDQQVAAGRVLSVAFVDLDYFKRINDTCSHEAGDEVLRRVAAVLDGAAHHVEGGFTARMGGEEFLVVLPDHDVDDAVRRLDDLRRSVAGIEWDGLTRDLPVTVSIGCATAAADGTERLLLLGAADRRLYAAKDAGRNRVVSTDPAPMTATAADVAFSRRSPAAPCEPVPATHGEH
jgi:diguanylate cyclase (GGDEF)-like protein